jgi:hypothetical protein
MRVPKGTYPPLIRAALLREPDGLTAREIADEIDLPRQDVVEASLKGMDDVYIDRWLNGKAVYIAIPIPEDCPKT